MEPEIKKLVEEARRARDCSLSLFSNFCVGAAVETDDGKIYTGCNIESASYGLTVCAERVAVWKALSESERHFKRLAVVVDTYPLTPPCGTCRQIIWEFCRNATIILANLRGDIEITDMNELLPRAFDARFLKEVGETQPGDSSEAAETKPAE
ncbi:MAG: cytidine deaminase [Acidobacteriota bacterium]|nr:cytidine deaminase [Acidobacteriota bacterium]